eukprot:scaffold3607_cov114-Isochrysis_galbana.AAC.1
MATDLPSIDGSSSRISSTSWPLTSTPSLLDATCAEPLRIPPEPRGGGWDGASGSPFAGVSRRMSRTASAPCLLVHMLYSGHLDEWMHIQQPPTQPQLATISRAERRSAGRAAAARWVSPMPPSCLS